jgi:tetratricopeptide (TPR) repeat protein
MAGGMAADGPTTQFIKGGCNINQMSKGAASIGTYTCTVINTPAPPGPLSHLFEHLVNMLFPAGPAVAADLSPEMRQTLAESDSQAKTERLTALLKTGAPTDNSRASLYAGRAASERAQGQLSQAQDDYQRAWLFNNSEPAYGFGYARILIDRSEYAKATELFGQMLESPAGAGSAVRARLFRSTVLLGRAQAEMYSMHIDPALQSTQQAADLLKDLPAADPDVAKAQFTATVVSGIALFGLNRLDEADAAFDTALTAPSLRQAPDDEIRAGILALRAAILQQTGKPAAAKRMIDEAVAATNKAQRAGKGSPEASVVILLSQAQIEMNDDPDVAARAATQVASIARAMTPQTLPSSASVSAAMWILGSIQDRKGNVQGATDFMRQSVDVLRAQAKVSPEAKPFLSDRLGQYANFALWHHDLATARDAVEEAIGIDHDADAREVDRQRLFASHLILSAQVDQAGGLWAEAIAPLDHALRIARDAARSTPMANGMVANVLLLESSAQGGQGEIDVAMSSVDDALVLLAALAQTDPVASRPVIAPGLESICGASAGGVRGVKQCETGINIWRRVVQDQRDKLELAFLLLNLGGRWFRLEDAAGAIGPVKEAVDLRQAAAANDAAVLPDLAMAEEAYGQALFQAGQTQDAETRIAHARAILTNVVPKTEAVSASYAEVLGFQMSIFFRTGRNDLAVSTGQEAAAGFRALAAHDAARYQPALAGILSDLGSACYAAHQPCAAEALTESVATFEASEKAGQPVDRYRQSGALDALGHSEMDRGQVQAARQHFATAVGVLEALHKEDDRQTPNLGIALEDLADAEVRSGAGKAGSLHRAEARKLRGAAASPGRPAGRQ